jgi:MOSC domain-containing protein YiiM
MMEQRTISGDKSGLTGQVECHQFRQILILNSATLRSFSIQPGVLKENVLVDFDGLYEIPSGTEVKIGTLRVRLTFHCEPCKKVAHLASPKALLHQRGYLGTIVNSGTVNVGDSLSVLGKLHESVPYEPFERVKWFLDKTNERISARDLTSAIALQRTYCRVLPRYLNRLGSKYASKVVFASH